MDTVRFIPLIRAAEKTEHGQVLNRLCTCARVIPCSAMVSRGAQQSSIDSLNHRHGPFQARLGSACMKTYDFFHG